MRLSRTAMIDQSELRLLELRWEPHGQENVVSFGKFAVFGALLLSVGTRAEAGYLVTLSGSNTYKDTNHPLAASAEFALVGGKLQITLSNTYARRYDATVGQIVPSDILTGLFFDVAGTPTLTYDSAGLAPGSAFVNGSGDSDLRIPTSPGGGWGFRQSSSSLAPANGIAQHYVLGTAGWGILNGNPTNGVGNLEYGLVNPGYQSGDGNTGVNSNVLIKSSIVFVLGGSLSGDLASMIQNVRFQYGTALNEPALLNSPPPTTAGEQRIPAVPEPTSIALAGFAGVGMAVRAWRRRRQQAA